MKSEKPHNPKCWLILVLLASLLFSPATPLWAAAGGGDISLDTPPDVLDMQIRHLSVKELQAEADRWLVRLQDTVFRLNQVKVEIWRENQALQKAETVESETIGSSKSEKAADPPDREAQVAQSDIKRKLENKEASLNRLALLREERMQVIDRLVVVVDHLSDILGRTDAGAEKDEVLVYRRYIDAIKADEVDTSDFQALRSAARSWLVSPEGGKRLATNFGKFLAIVAGFWLLSLVLGWLAGRAMSFASGASQILRSFVAKTVGRATFIGGLLLGMSALEINTTPLLAIIGAAGFIVAFALQNTLSNFASGLMIMFYKPFDIGDLVETSALTGTVKSMTLVTTNMLTPDNKLLVVPNNELWGKVITNVTGSSERRVDMLFRIGYGDDIGLAERILREVVKAHPAVLDQPEPDIAVSELADSSVNLLCRPWVKTADYWTAYWEITRTIKERFEAEGISIPYPHTDVHLVTEKPVSN